MLDPDPDSSQSGSTTLVKAVITGLEGQAEGGGEEDDQQAEEVPHFRVQDPKIRMQTSCSDKLY
jgi:hypothetical protein